MSDIDGPTVKINADASGVDSAIQHVTQQFETLQTQAAGIGGKFEALGASMSSIGAGLTAGITAPMTVAVASIGAMTQQAANFQSQMAEVFTLMPGLGKEAMGQMSDDVKAFSSEFGIMSEQVVPALYQAISAGVPSDNVFSFLEVAAKSSIGGVTDLETAVDGLTTVMNSYTNDQVSAERAADAMFTAAKLGKTNFEELSQSMYQATPMANALGVSIEDVAAAFATLTAQGTPTNVSATQMKALFKELLDPASELSKYLDEVTEGADFKQLSDSGKSLFDVISILNNGLKEDGKQWTEVTGSIEASQAGMVLSSEMMGNFTNQMKDASGAVDEAYKTMSESAVQQMNKVKAELHNMVIDIGESFLPILQNDIMPILKDDLVPYIQNTVVPAIKGFADWFSNLDDRSKKAVAGIGIFAAALGPLMMVLGPFVSAGGSLINTLATIGKVAQTTTAATGVTTLVSSLAQLEKINPTPALQYIAPIGPAASGAASQVGLLSSALVAVGPALIVGAGAVAGAFVAYQTNFADFRTNVDNAIEHVNNAANLIDRGQYQQAGRELANAVGDGFATAKDLIVKGIPDAAVFAYELDSQMRVAIGDMSGGFGAALREMVDGALASAGAAFEQFAINDAAFAKSFSESLRNGDWAGAAADAAGKFKDSFYTNGKIDAGKLLDGVDSLTSKLQPALDMITLISNPFGGAASVLGGESGNILDGYFNPEKYKKTSDEIEKFERAVAKSLQNAGTEVKTFADKSSADLNNAMSKWQDAFEKSGKSLEEWTESLKKSGDYSQFISDMDAFAAKYPELAEKAGGAANVMQQLDFKPVQFEDGSIFYAYENGVLTPIIDNPVKIMMELNDYENDMRSAYEIYLDYKSQIENAPIMVQMMGPDVSTLSPDTQWISNEGGGTGKNINDVRGTQTTPDNKTVNQNTDAVNTNAKNTADLSDNVSELFRMYPDWDTYQNMYQLQNKGASNDLALQAYEQDKKLAGTAKTSTESSESSTESIKSRRDNTDSNKKLTDTTTKLINVFDKGTSVNDALAKVIERFGGDVNKISGQKFAIGEDEYTVQRKGLSFEARGSNTSAQMKQDLIEYGEELNKLNKEKAEALNESLTKDENWIEAQRDIAKQYDDKIKSLEDRYGLTVSEYRKLQTDGERGLGKFGATVQGVNKELSSLPKIAFKALENAFNPKVVGELNSTSGSASRQELAEYLWDKYYKNVTSQKDFMDLIRPWSDSQMLEAASQWGEYDTSGRKNTLPDVNSPEYAEYLKLQDQSKTLQESVNEALRDGLVTKDEAIKWLNDFGQATDTTTEQTKENILSSRNLLEIYQKADDLQTYYADAIGDGTYSVEEQTEVSERYADVLKYLKDMGIDATGALEGLPPALKGLVEAILNLINPVKTSSDSASPGSSSSNPTTQVIGKTSESSHQLFAKMQNDFKALNDQYKAGSINQSTYISKMKELSVHWDTVSRGPTIYKEALLGEDRQNAQNFIRMIKEQFRLDIGATGADGQKNYDPSQKLTKSIDDFITIKPIPPVEIPIAPIEPVKIPVELSQYPTRNPEVWKGGVQGNKPAPAPKPELGDSPRRNEEVWKGLTKEIDTNSQTTSKAVLEVKDLSSTTYDFSSSASDATNTLVSSSGILQEVAKSSFDLNSMLDEQKVKNQETSDILQVQQQNTVLANDSLLSLSQTNQDLSQIVSMATSPLDGFRGSIAALGDIAAAAMAKINEALAAAQAAVASAGPAMPVNSGPQYSPYTGPTVFNPSSASVIAAQNISRYGVCRNGDWLRAFASGGPVTENGPAYLHQGEYVLRRDEVNRPTSGQPIQVNVNMQNSRFGDAELAKTLPKMYTRQTRRALKQAGYI